MGSPIFRRHVTQRSDVAVLPERCTTMAMRTHGPGSCGIVCGARCGPSTARRTGGQGCQPVTAHPRTERQVSGPRTHTSIHMGRQRERPGVRYAYTYRAAGLGLAHGAGAQRVQGAPPRRAHAGRPQRVVVRAGRPQRRLSAVHRPFSRGHVQTRMLSSVFADF